MHVLPLPYDVGTWIALRLGVQIADLRVSIIRNRRSTMFLSWAVPIRIGGLCRELTKAVTK